MERRELKTRGTAWAKTTARILASTGISPNQISILSVIMSIIVMVMFYCSTENTFLLIGAAIFIQLRLLCNLFDGMVAIEHGKKTSTGDIFNDLPDRFADIFIILGFSLAVRHMPYAIHIGWAASLFAVMTAYVRVLGRSLGTESYFIGPMAKQHRMFLITISAVIELIFRLTHIDFSFAYYALIFIAIGSLVTTVRRLIKIIKVKEEEGA